MKRLRMSAALGLLVSLSAMSAFASDPADRLHSPDEAGVHPAQARRSLAVAPVYPLDAMPDRAAAVVTASAVVERDGSVSAVEIVEIDLPGLGFEEAVEEALLQWKFRPAVKEGERVVSTSLVRFRFRAPDTDPADTALLAGSTEISTASYLKPRGGRNPVGVASYQDDEEAARAQQEKFQALKMLTLLVSPDLPKDLDSWRYDDDLELLSREEYETIANGELPR